MNENLKKFDYTGDKPSPIVKADRIAKAARAVVAAVVEAEKIATFGVAKIKAEPVKKSKKHRIKKAK